MGSSERATLLALTLNEIDGVKAIMPQIDREWADQIIIADGGSTDGTIEWLRDNGYEVRRSEEEGDPSRLFGGVAADQGRCHSQLQP